MVPNNQLETQRIKRKKLTDRQLRRRLSNIVERVNDVYQIPNSQSNKINLDSNYSIQKIMTFGKKSSVFQGNKEFIIKLSEDDAEELDSVELQGMLSRIKSPMNNFIRNVNPYHNILKRASDKMLHIGLWMRNVSHYSGGRVYLISTAHILAEMGHKVSIISDNPCPFMNDFKYMEVEDRIEFICGPTTSKTNWLLKCEQNNIDIVFTSPRIMEGFLYANKWNLPCYAFIFESPNYIRKHRGGADATDEYWSEYKNAVLNYSNGVFCFPGPAEQGVREWLHGWDGKIYVASPSVNITAADKVDSLEENEITFIGRHVDFKCPDDIIQAVGQIPKNIRPLINFIGSHNVNIRQRMINKAILQGVEIKFYAGCNDFEKFKIIKRSKVIVIPTRFEGFGIPPSEALYCKKPVVVYDLPITKHIYGDTINYAKAGNLVDLAKKIKILISDPALRKEQSFKGYGELFNVKNNNLQVVPYKVKENWRNILYPNAPRITAGMIVYNGSDLIELSLKSIYDSVDEIIIVEGAVEDYMKYNNISDHNSIDDTIKKIHNFFDPLNKITLVRNKKPWKNKNEMQNAIAERIQTEIYLKVDVDEIWKESDIEYIRRIFFLKNDIDIIYMKRWHFWKNLQTVALGGQWDTACARAWRFRKDWRHPMDDKRGFNYYVDKDGEKVSLNSLKYKSVTLMKRMHYHLGYCRNNNEINNKINYYANRGIEVNVENNYKNWEKGKPTSSTHPDGTTAGKFTGQLPKILLKNYNELLNVDPKSIVENNTNMLASPLNQQGR